MYICTDCGNESLKWKGQCEFCKEWNTLKESKVSSKLKKDGEVGELQNIKSKGENTEERIVTSSSELNAVLGGGIVQGSIILLSGEPGIGKSTLSLQLGNWIHEDIIYISGEETQGQISSRAERLDIEGKNIKILAENNIENVISTLKKNETKLVILDSISVMYSSEISGTAGSISQVRAITEMVVEYGKTTNTTFIIIGHVTKDGSLAGPKTLEHMVDTVLYFEGDKFDNLRILRCLKNRFGSSSEIGLYKMEEKGLIDIENPGLEFISDSEDALGSALSVTMEGTRPLVIETEALTMYTKFGYPKRSARGIVGSKLDLIIAVLGKYSSIKLDSHDVYCNISRGLSIGEPGLDLAIAASIISSKTGKALSKKALYIGEISLTGKIKNVMFLERRIKEAEKMGFETLYIPEISSSLSSLLPKNAKIKCVQIKNIGELSKMFQ
ncbi:DNA repair protein RadA [Candidatus Gracilibacteria bacterium]|nr:DNA repair protein RadA [Candidatus Gracilibacteria bacterium]